MAESDSDTAANHAPVKSSFTETEIRPLVAVLMSLKSGVADVDMDAFMVNAGFDNYKTASNTWDALRKKLAATLPADLLNFTPSTSPSSSSNMASSDDGNTRSKQLRNLYNNASMSDITVHFAEGYGAVKAHKAVLSLASPYFARMFTGNSVEARTGKLYLSRIDPRGSARQLLRYIYGIEIEVPTTSGIVYLDYQMDLMDLADKYEFPSLFKIAQAEFTDRLELTMGTPAFAEQVKHVYTAPSGEARKIAADICRANLANLMSSKEFKAVLLAQPQLAVDLLEDKVKSDAAGPNKRRRV